MIWLVTNGYRGNGFVTAIVEAENERMALAKGELALRDHAAKVPLANRGTHEESVEHYVHALKAEQIELPYVTEMD